MKKYRILMVSEDVPAPSMGGLGKHVVTLANALADAGHTVELMGNADFKGVDFSWRPGRDYFPELQGSRRGWKEHALGVFNPLKRKVLAQGFAKAIMARAGQFDIVHYHGHVPDLAFCIPESIAFVQTRHDQGADCLKHTRFFDNQVCNEVDAAVCVRCINAKPSLIQKQVSAIAVRQFRDRVKAGFKRHETIYVSEMLRRNLQRTLGSETPARGHVVHNFIDWRLLKAELHQPGIDSNQESIFIAGKLTPAKGISAFLDTVTPLLGKSQRVTVAGDGPEESVLRRNYENSAVTILGWCEYRDVLAHTLMADKVVVPSICEESCATSILEALALGRVVYALERGGTTELVRYQRFPRQLRLYPDLTTLAAAVCSDLPVYEAIDFDCVPDADVTMKIEQILAIYALASDRSQRHAA